MNFESNWSTDLTFLVVFFGAPALALTLLVWKLVAVFRAPSDARPSQGPRHIGWLMPALVASVLLVVSLLPLDTLGVSDTIWKLAIAVSVAIALAKFSIGRKQQASKANLAPSKVDRPKHP